MPARDKILERVAEYIEKEIEMYTVDFTFAKKYDDTEEILYNEGAMNALKDTLDYINREWL